MTDEIREEYCLQYGHFNPRSHTCIRGIESLQPICLKCKGIWMREQEMSKCSASLIELRNAMKREIPDERAASGGYQEMATKMTALGETNYADIFRLLSDAEMMHRVVLESLVEALDFRCEGQ